jgi:protein O-mannosyl-transferase
MASILAKYLSPANSQRLAMLLLLILSLLAYAPAYHGPEIWDDTDWLTNMRTLYEQPGALWRIWTDSASAQQYYPVTTSSFWLDYQLWGAGRTRPHHVENALIHGGSAVLFFVLLARLGVRGRWLAAALFAVHPVMAESVAWITERKNALCTFFSLLTLLAQGHAVSWWPSERGKGWPCYLLASLVFALAMLSKVGAVTLLGVIPVLTWWRHGRLQWRRDLLPLLPWLVLSLPLIVVTGRLESEMVLHGDPSPALSGVERLLISSQLPWFYLWKLLWPLDLSPMYYRWSLQPHVWWHWLGVPAISLVLGVAVWKRWRGALALMLLFLGTLFPLLGWLDVNGMKYAWAADRWVYVPAMALFVGVAWLVTSAPGKPLRAALAVLVLAPCFMLCREHSAIYSDVETFWQTALDAGASAWKANNDYGSQLADKSRHAEAALLFRRALEAKPDYASSHVNLANSLEALGLRDEALQHLDEALKLQPEHNSIIHYNRAIILERLNRVDEALASYSEAARIKPDFIAARNDKGNLLLLARRFDEAIQCFNEILALRPDDAKSLTSIGNAYFFQQQPGPALEYFTKAIAADPKLVSPLTNSAWIMATTANDELRNGPQALQSARTASQLSAYTDPSILQVLAAAHAEVGDFEKAIAVSQQAARLAETQGKTGLAESIRLSQAQFERGETHRTP